MESKNGNPEGGKKVENESVDDNFNISCWSDMRIFDDVATENSKEITEDDGGWYDDEGAKMCEKHGRFIKVSFANDQMDYLCEICQIHSNSRTSLAIHCNGMKHLKKKVEFEKTNSNTDDKVFTAENSNSPSNRHDDSSEEPLRSSSDNHRDYRGGDSRPYKKRHDDYSPRGSRSRGYSGQSRGYSDRPRGRGRGVREEGMHKGDWSWGTGYIDQPRGRGYNYHHSSRGYRGDQHRGYNNQPRGRGYNERGEPIRLTSKGVVDLYPNRGSGVFKISDHVDGPEEHYSKPPSRDRSRSPYGSMEDSRRYWDADPTLASYPPNSHRYRLNEEKPRLPPSYNRMARELDKDSRISSPYSNSRERKRSPDYQARRPVVHDILPTRFRDYDSPKLSSTEDSMAMFRAPSPPKVNLKQTSRVDSLSQLSKIAILSAEDAKMGIGVVSSLLRSLKNFYQVKANWKAVDHLIDAELKIGAVAALETSLYIKKSYESPKKDRLPY